MNVGRLRRRDITSEAEAAFRARADAQVIVTRCLHCRWLFRGSAADVRRAFKTHREVRHGES